MKLFTINKEGKFLQFKEQVFKSENKEIDNEILERYKTKPQQDT